MLWSTIFIVSAGLTTATTTTTTTTPNSAEIAALLNNLYQREDSGVLVRAISFYGANAPWEAGKIPFHPERRSTSFAILNKFAWSEQRQVVNYYSGWNPSSPAVFAGMIAADWVLPNFTTCAAPLDANSNNRWHDGCGCVKTPPTHCGQPDNWDWCSGSPPPKGNWPCMWRMPGELSNLLQRYKARNDASYNERYNEIVVDGSQWNADPKKNIWAFLLPDACSPGTTCYNDAARWYGFFKAKFGRKAFVGLDVRNQASPFHEAAEPSINPVTVETLV